MSPACRQACANFDADTAVLNQNLLRVWKSYTRLGPRWYVVHQMLWLDSMLWSDSIQALRDILIRFGKHGQGGGHTRVVSVGGEGQGFLQRPAPFELQA